MKFFLTFFILNSFVSHQSIRLMPDEKSVCFHDKSTKTSLTIEDTKEFIFIDEEILLGTKYLLLEKGCIEQTRPEQLVFVVTSVAMLEANKIDLTNIEDVSGGLRTYGELSNDAIKLSSKGLTLKRCSCNKKEFKFLN